MKAKLVLDNLNHIITFKSKSLNISYGCSPLILNITSIDEYDCGYMVIYTNVGEEYIDLLGMLEVDRYDLGFVKEAKKILGRIKLKDIELFSI